MNSIQVQLVQSSFKKVEPIADQAAAMFYQRLFELDSTLRPLFRGDLTQQGRKLMQMLSIAVNGLSHPQKIEGAVRELGRRHVTDYGVNAAHYDTVGSALLWTLEQGLGAHFTQEVKQAWAETYLLVAGMMKEGAAGRA